MSELIIGSDVQLKQRTAQYEHNRGTTNVRAPPDRQCIFHGTDTHSILTALSSDISSSVETVSRSRFVHARRNCDASLAVYNGSSARSESISPPINGLWEAQTVELCR